MEFTDDEVVATNMAQAPEIRKLKFQDSVVERLLKDTVNFLAPFKQNELKAGRKKETKTCKTLNVLK